MGGVQRKHDTYVWELIRETFETTTSSVKQIAEMYGVEMNEIYSQASGRKWVKKKVQKDALHNQAILNDVKDLEEFHERRSELKGAGPYEDLVLARTQFLERRHFHEEVNNLTLVGNTRVMAKQLEQYITNNDLLNEVGDDGLSKGDINNFNKLILAIKGLMTEHKQDSGVNVQVNNQVGIMEDIVNQHKSIYDDVNYGDKS